MRHVLEFTDHGGRFEVTDERIECAKTEFSYRLHQGHHTFDERLKTWLDEYSLGDLWGSEQLGGNRW